MANKQIRSSVSATSKETQIKTMRCPASINLEDNFQMMIPNIFFMV